MGLFLALIFVFFALLAYLYYHAWKDAKYFQDRGVYYLGNGFYRLILDNFKGLSFADNVINKCKEIRNQNQKFAGIKDFGRMATIVTDTELLKNIMVSEFDHFTDHRSLQLSERDHLMKRTIFCLQGDKWKSARSLISPAFSHGKVRKMFNIFDQSSTKLVSYVQQEIDRSGGSGEMDLERGFQKYTLDIFASVLLAIDSRVFNISESPTQFETMAGNWQFRIDGLKFLKWMLMINVPSLANFLGLTYFSSETQDYFTHCVTSAIRLREESGERRDDVLQAMMDVRGTDSEKSVDIDDIVSHSLNLILAGLDTTQSLLDFMAYVLAIHPETQDRLFQEVCLSLENNQGKLTFDTVHGMEYLNMLTNETLRCYSPAMLTDRECTKDYKVPNSDFIITKGHVVVVPILGIHRGENNYPDPEKFDPERWSPENRAKIQPSAFLPFGNGPRMCPGMEFALIEAKLAIARLVYEFHIEPSEKTLIPMKFSSSGTLKPEGGMWLKFTNRRK